MSDNQIQVFDEMLATVTVAVRPILEMKITDEPSQRNALAAGSQIKGLLKEVENRRKEVLAPLKAEIDRINAAADRVKNVLGQPDRHISGQLNTWAAELERVRTEKLRLQREQEERDRQIAAAKRAADERVLRERQEAERREREAASQAERDRLQAIYVAEQEEMIRKNKEREEAASFFGRSGPSAEELETARIEAEQKAAAEARAIADKADAERVAQEAQQERERIAEMARLEREESERLALAAEQRKVIEMQKVKGTRMEVVVEVVNAWAVPRNFVKPPEVILTEVKRVYKLNKTPIAGLKITEEARVAQRADA